MSFPVSLWAACTFPACWELGLPSWGGVSGHPSLSLQGGWEARLWAIGRAGRPAAARKRQLPQVLVGQRQCYSRWSSAQFLEQGRSSVNPCLEIVFLVLFFHFQPSLLPPPQLFLQGFSPNLLEASLLPQEVQFLNVRNRPQRIVLVSPGCCDKIPQTGRLK